MSKVKLITNERNEDFQQEVNDFLESITGEQLISIQYATTSTAITTHTEYGVYPSVEYSALIHYKE
ncbi:sporulation protein Cse60 [Solibacillus sp. CAU 1738]|uniref:sporulation protein Cse60 n=1 Tax=Solibacillus sp. CAU 1738 TaxID=3140363 RepID=UPI003260495E